MKRIFLVAMLAIAALLAGSMALVLALTSSGATAAPPDSPTASDPQITNAPAPAQPPDAAALGSRITERRGETARGTWNAPAKLPWATPLADRVTRKAIRKALLAGPVQSRLARCVDEVGGFGGAPSPTGSVPRAEPASLMLEIETLGAEVRILDAQARVWGGASEAMVACARTVLRGQIIPTPAGRRPAGERIRMPFPLNPRSETVASR